MKAYLDSAGFSSISALGEIIARYSFFFFDGGGKLLKAPSFLRKLTRECGISLKLPHWPPSAPLKGQARSSYRFAP